MTLDPKDCSHLIGTHFNRMNMTVVILDKDDFDLLEEADAVAFNYCPWCGIDLTERDFTED